MPGNPHNVDICVTCICDKPPQLPLREELPSLGIEVIYNAKGVGAEAAEKETKKEKDKFHQERMKDLLKQSRREKSSRSKRSALSPPGWSPFSMQLAKRNETRKADPPEDLGIPKALSYGSYQRSLDIRTKNETASISSSIETSSTMDEKCQRNIRKKKLTQRLKGLFAKKKNPNDPPNAVEFPNMQNLEEAALQEAFNAFMSDEDIDIPAKPSNIKLSKKPRSGKKDIFPDLLEGSKDNPEQLEKDNELTADGNKKVEAASDYSSSGVDQTTVSSLGNESSIFKKNIFYDAEAYSKQAVDRLNKLAVDQGIEKAESHEDVIAPETHNELDGTRGNIKVKLMGNDTDNHITEMYDLTEISILSEKPQKVADINAVSQMGLKFLGNDLNNNVFPDDEINDVEYHGSLAPTSPHGMNYNDQSQYSEESSVPVPEIHDMYGKVFLDVSDVYEENGPGSPLVLSPVLKRDVSSFTFSPASYAIPNRGQGKKTQNPYLPSFYSNLIRDDEFVPDGRDDIVVYRAERDDDLSSGFRERNLSPVRLDIASPYTESIRRARTTAFDKGLGGLGLNMKAKRFDQALGHKYSSRTKISARPTFSPASRSRDSYDSLKDPKVSFSEDVEDQRLYKKEKQDYEKSMEAVKSSLSVIVNEGRDLNEPLPSALSREADAAFQAFTDQLDISENPRTPQQILLESLSYGDPLPFDFEETIKLNPSIASQRLPDADTYALHSACLRAFPKRFSKDQTCRVMDLIHDLHLHRKLTEALVKADPETCRRLDANGDLPVHIMARQLMEWEGQWYQKVYDKAKGQSDSQDSGAGITTLYQAMSECINLLLQPLLEDDSLCLLSGSVGRILPLHIAAIFTVQYNTMKAILEMFPNATSIKCDLSGIKTFVPDHSTPLELHDRLSTDFPKWEIQRLNIDPDEEMTQAMLDKIYNTTNGIRRSDLMFAFSPKILPYRKEAYRIRRMENMIQQEMQGQEENYDEFVLSRTAEAFWLWMCEFQDDDNISDHYAESVSRIIDSLPFNSVRFLASISNDEGHPVIDKAVPSCADAIIKRLEKISKTGIPIRMQSLLNMPVRSTFLRNFDDDIMERLRLDGQGFVGPLCRTIFNISETKYPSSFVILPYKLVHDAEGRLGLESSQAARVAMKFAEFLSDLTAPKNIIDILDYKICQTIGDNLVDELNRASRESRRKRFGEFLNLYESEVSYFYFIDDCTGIPIVDENNEIYPLIITDAVETVEKVFPMMLSGLVLMRGEKAIPILVDVLLNENIKLVLPHWIDAAKDLIEYTLSPHGDPTKAPLQGLLSSQEKLINFVQYGPTESQAIQKLRSGGLSNEWVVEVSLIKMVIEMHDPRHNFCYLSQERGATKVLWTRESDAVPDIQNRIDFVSPKTLKDTLRRNIQIQSPEPVMIYDLSDESDYNEEFEDMDVNNENWKNDGKNTRGSEYSSDEYKDSSSADEMPGMMIATAQMNNPKSNKKDDLNEAKNSESSSFLRKKQTRSTYTPPTESLYSELPPKDQYEPRDEYEQTSKSDDPFPRDSVVALRVQLDEQEDKLNSLRTKISQLDAEGDELEEREQRISSMMNEFSNQKEILEVPSRDGLEKAKALMSRICKLEERVRYREVEVGQLQNNVSLFQLEASSNRNSRRVNEDSSTSDESDVLIDESYPRGEQIQAQDEQTQAHSRDEDIKSMESGDALNLHEVPFLGFVDDDMTHEGEDDSTLYDSSIEGYSTGYSAAMLRP